MQCATHVHRGEDLTLRGGLDGTLRKERVGTVGVGDAVRSATTSGYGPIEVLHISISIMSIGP